MSLIECAECGRQISDHAPSCPGCGAPPEAYRTQVEELDMVSAELAPSSDAIDSAVSPDGRHLWYFPSVRAFVFGEDPLTLEQVFAMDKQRAFGWTRFDVRGQLHRAAKRHQPMADLPADPGPGLLEKFADASDRFADTLPAGSSAMICPHCQSHGTVRTQSVKQKKGISGGKATAAVLTGGLSILATGLSRKEKLTSAYCTKCGARWTF